MSVFVLVHAVLVGYCTNGPWLACHFVILSIAPHPYLCCSQTIKRLRLKHRFLWIACVLEVLWVCLQLNALACQFADMIDSKHWHKQTLSPLTLIQNRFEKGHKYKEASLWDTFSVQILCPRVDVGLIE